MNEDRKAYVRQLLEAALAADAAYVAAKRATEDARIAEEKARTDRFQAVVNLHGQIRNTRLTYCGMIIGVSHNGELWCDKVVDVEAMDPPDAAPVEWPGELFKYTDTISPELRAELETKGCLSFHEVCSLRGIDPEEATRKFHSEVIDSVELAGDVGAVSKELEAPLG